VTFWSHAYTKAMINCIRERCSETPQNFSYYHAKLVFDLPSYSFDRKIM